MINSRKSRELADYIMLMKNFMFTEEQFDDLIYRTRIVAKKRLNGIKIETYLRITNTGKNILDELDRIEIFLASEDIRISGLHGTIKLSIHDKELKDKLRKACESCEVNFMLDKVYKVS